MAPQMADDVSRRVEVVEARATVLEEKVRRAQVLILQLDASAATRSVDGLDGIGGGIDKAAVGGVPHLERLATRIGVLEVAHALRRSADTQAWEVAMTRLEGEVKALWSSVAAPPKSSELLPSARLVSPIGSPRLGQGIRQSGGDDRDDNATTGSLDELLQLITARVADATAEIGQRTARLEESLARVEAVDILVKGERKRFGELEQMVELLVTQRREDIQTTNAQFRDLRSDIRGLGDGINDDGAAGWAKEARELRSDLEDIRLAKLPSIFQHASRTSQVLADGLQELRQDVLTRLERANLTSTRPFASGDGGIVKDFESAAVLAAFRAELQELRKSITGSVNGPGVLDEHMRTLYAELAADIEGGVRQMRELWADGSRRLAALEPWREEHVALHAEVRAMRLERNEDRARVEAMAQEELVSLRSAIEDRFLALQDSVRKRQNTILDSPLALGLGGAPSLPRTPRARDGLAATALPRVITYGQSAQWLLTAMALQSAADYGGLLASDEFEVSRVALRLKFFPGGSAVRQENGFCSLYAMCMRRVRLKFRLFAGKYQTPVLACEYGEQRDHGRHDLCALDAVLDADGGVLVGLEILDVRPLESAGANE